MCPSSQDAYLACVSNEYDVMASSPAARGRAAGFCRRNACATLSHPDFEIIVIFGFVLPNFEIYNY
jgi:hypothetical protein